MIYPFKCPKCGIYDEKVWHVSEYTDIVKCPMCAGFMDRVWTPTMVSIPNLEGFNHGLGCKQSQVKDKIRALRSEGRDIVELGNEKIKPKEHKSNYDLTAKDIHRLDQIMAGNNG